MILASIWKSPRHAGGVAETRLLGILMIPLRAHAHRAAAADMKYPEGTACAELLKAGANA